MAQPWAQPQLHRCDVPGTPPLLSRCASALLYQEKTLGRSSCSVVSPKWGHISASLLSPSLKVTLTLVKVTICKNWGPEASPARLLFLSFYFFPSFLSIFDFFFSLDT